MESIVDVVFSEKGLEFLVIGNTYPVDLLVQSPRCKRDNSRKIGPEYRLDSGIRYDGAMVSNVPVKWQVAGGYNL